LTLDSCEAFRDRENNGLHSDGPQVGQLYRPKR
jgi:hypothetical protein